MVRFALMYVRPFIRNEEAQDLVEYALLTGLIVLGAVLALTEVGTQVRTIFENISNDLTQAAAN